MPIIVPIARDERRLMQKAIHKTRDKSHTRRLTALLMLHRGDSVSKVASILCCTRSSVGRWISWFTLYGTEGLIFLRPGRARRWLIEEISVLLVQLAGRSPGDFDYQRSRWNTELLTIKVNEITGCQLHAGCRNYSPLVTLCWSGMAKSCTHIT